MIFVITCTCGGAERTARDVLNKGGMPNYMEFPITKGKQASLKVLDSLKPVYGARTEFNALYGYVKKTGRFVVVIGCSDNIFRWSDVSRGAIKERIDGEIIVSEFKDK